MLLALEVDHGHRQRVRQLATRRGERGRDQDDRPTPGEWGGKGAGADVQRVDTIDVAACHHPPKREREREEGSHMGGKGAGADTQRVDTIDAAACHHPPQREGGRRERTATTRPTCTADRPRWRRLLS